MKAGSWIVVATMALAATHASAGQLYQWKDAQGRTVYSDQAPPASAQQSQQKAFNGSVIERGEPYALRIAREKHPVTVYLSPCGAPCDSARQLLSERGVPHAVRDLQTDEAAREALQKLTGKLNVPVLVVGSEKIEGYDAARWQAALDRAGYPKAAGNSQRPSPQAGTPTSGAGR